MLLSMDLGQHSIAAAVLERDELVKQFTIPAPAVEKGRIVNVGDTAKLVSQALREQGVKARGCVFVLPPAAVLAKEMQLPPKLGRTDLLQMVRTNFSGVTDAGADYAVDYLTLEEGAEHIVLGLLVRRQTLMGCLALAKQLGLRCRRVELRVSALRKLRRRIGAADITEILVYVEGASAEINLFDGGRVFSRTAEIQAQAPQNDLLKNWAMSFNDTLMAGQEQEDRIRLLAEQVRSIQQFQLSRNGQRPVGRVYLYGEVEPRYCQELESAVMTPVEPLDTRYDALPYLNALGGGLGERKQQLNLLDGMRRRTREEKRAARRKTLLAALLCALFIIGCGIGGFFAMQNAKVNEDIDFCTQYLNSPETLASTVRARQAQRLLVEQKAYNQTLETFQVYFGGLFRLGSTHVKGIYGLAAQFSVSISFFDIESGSLRMICTAPDSTVAAEFSKTLQQQGAARDVSFTGYALETGEVGKGYRFELGGTIPGEGTP